MGNQDMIVRDWLEALASDAATPGGGSAAGVVAAAGAALIAMTGRLTLRSADTDMRERMERLIARADGERLRFLALADEDAAAFGKVMEAYRMAKETDEERQTRSQVIQQATADAAAVPLEIATRAVDLIELAEDGTAMGNPNAASDAYSGGALLFAASVAANANVRINADGLKDRAKSQALIDQVLALRERADHLLMETQTAFLLRLSS